MALPDPVLLPSGAYLWRTALAAMSLTTPPCRHLTAARWGELHTKGLDFLDRFGAVHPEYRALASVARDALDGDAFGIEETAAMLTAVDPSLSP